MIAESHTSKIKQQVVEIKYIYIRQHIQLYCKNIVPTVSAFTQKYAVISDGSNP